MSIIANYGNYMHFRIDVIYYLHDLVKGDTGTLDINIEFKKEFPFIKYSIR